MRGKEGPRRSRAKPAQAKIEAKVSVGRKAPKNEGAKVLDLEKRLAEALGQLQTRERELVETQEQQTATAEILRVISASPTDVQPVFDAITESAARLCAVADGWIVLTEGDTLRGVSAVGQLVGQLPVYNARRVPLTRESVIGRAILDRTTIHIDDLAAASEAEYPEGRALQRMLGHRTQLVTPLLREGVAVGAILLARFEVRLFSERQIALLQTFADQAVIAIENVRLFNETKEALEQQTATSEILRVISGSPTDIQPVFDTIVQNAVRLCAATFGGLQRIEGGRMTLDAQCGVSADELAILQRDVFPLPISRESATGRAVCDQMVIHIHDIREDPDFGMHRLQTMQGFRTILAVPMLREGVPIGALALWRRDVHPFSDTEISLVQTFADQAVIAIENVRLFAELQEKTRVASEAHAQVSEALARETATSEILRVIGSSLTDAQPVFETIARSGLTVCAALGCVVFVVDGDMLRMAATAGVRPERIERFRRDYPISLSAEIDTALAVSGRRMVHLADIANNPNATADDIEVARLAGYRTRLMVPMVRGDRALGLIAVTREDSAAFPDHLVELLRTFADQAVIAIENVRLFTELQARNQDLTATSEILRVISQSQIDVQPVFDIIAESALRLCEAKHGNVFLFDGGLIHLAAVAGTDRGGTEAVRRSFPQAPGAASATTRAILTRRSVIIPDVLEDPDFKLTEMARAAAFRSVMSIPMLRAGESIGAITVARGEAGPFSDKQIAMLQTFADQAVIAIENVRLFTELQASNRDLTGALEQQTATGEILQTITHTQTDPQPVFEAIVRSAARLCHSGMASIALIDGRMLHLPANFGASPEALAAVRARFPRALDNESVTGTAILTRSVVQLADTEDPSVVEFTRQAGRVLGYRSLVAVPMLRDGEVLGAINVVRREPGRFSDAEVELLKAFASQAVIAVENVRLFRELEARTVALTRSVEQLTALGEVGRAVSSSLDLETVLTTIVSRAVELSGLDGGVVFEYDEDAEEFVQRAQTETGSGLAEARRTNRIRKGEGVLGRTAITLESVQVPDITLPGAYAGRLRENLIESGIRAILAVPMVYEGRLIGCLGVTRNQPGDFPSNTIELLWTFATQSALAIQNARLFREIKDKSRQLEAASQHKSEFLANMSHELRTPLNAIIGFSEVLNERMFGELNAKQEEYLKDIYASGQHLLSLINDILDLSKIEAGRMELELTDFNLPATLDNALTLVRERAGRRGIALGLTVDERLEQIHADERKVRQVVLNLLSNAIKFTPEGGRIEVRAVPVDGMVEISVSDTGVGIAPEDQEAIFEEFRQVGTTAKKVEGTGLGLALSRKFVELHGGRIRVESQTGAGSTFTFAVPICRGE